MLNERKKIVVCEDDLITAVDIRNYLKSKGLDVYKPVTSGRELMEVATSYFPSLIVSDITLDGELDGIEAISRINELIKIPYIFITGHSEYASLIDSYYLHPIDVFIKPINLDELYAAVNASINHPRSERPSYYYLG